MNSRPDTWGALVHIVQQLLGRGISGVLQGLGEEQIQFELHTVRPFKIQKKKKKQGSVTDTFCLPPGLHSLWEVLHLQCGSSEFTAQPGRWHG